MPHCCKITFLLSWFFVKRNKHFLLAIISFHLYLYRNIIIEYVVSRLIITPRINLINLTLVRLESWNGILNMPIYLKWSLGVVVIGVLIRHDYYIVLTTFMVPLRIWSNLNDPLSFQLIIKVFLKSS